MLHRRRQQHGQLLIVGGLKVGMEVAVARPEGL